MNSYFATVRDKLAAAVPSLADNGQQPILNATNSRTEPPLLAEFTIIQCSVQNKVNALKTNKSTDPDDIPSKLLKLAGDAIVPALTGLYRYRCGRKTVFSTWKMVKFTPIFKKNDEAECGNYRPFSLLSIASKILESEVNNTLVRHIPSKRITKSQIGSGHTTQVIRQNTC